MLSLKIPLFTFKHVHVQFPRPLPLARTSYWREQRERQKLVLFMETKCNYPQMMYSTFIMIFVVILFLYVA